MSFRDNLYMVWKGVEGDQRMYYSHFDGFNWQQQQQVPTGMTSVGPSLSSFRDNLYMVWKGVEGDQRMYYSHFDGFNWQQQQQVPTGGTTYRPSLTYIVPIPPRRDDPTPRSGVPIP